jgi:hypothetical protein
MRAVKAGLAPPLLGRGEEVLKEKGSFDVRVGPTRVPFQERKASELGGIISMVWWSLYSREDKGEGPS